MSAAAGQFEAAPKRRRVPRPHGIAGFILRRIALGILTLFLCSIVVFAATQALPGDAARAILGRNATPESLAVLRAQLHLNEPVLSQYFHWLGGFVQGDLGTSLTGSQEPVTTLIGQDIKNSAVLVVIAALISIPLSIALGSIAARRRDTMFDHATQVTLLTLAAIPEFVTSILLVVFAGTTVFHILPPVSYIPPGANAWDYPKELVLPVTALVIAVAPYIARIMRASMIEVLESDYVEMARLKGMPERTVLWRHALPNGIAPAIQAIALSLAYLAGGIVVVETVFAYPGIGNAFVQAVTNRDLPTVQALGILIAAVYVFLNVAADVATILVSPRLRTSLK